MSDRLSVLQICSYYIGTTLYQNLFDSLEKFGIREDVYVFASKKDVSKDIHAQNVFLSRCYSEWERYIFQLKHKSVINDMMVKLDVTQYSVMHAHSLFSNGYIAYRINQQFGIPYVVAVRNTDVNVFFRWMICLRSLGVRILNNADKVIFISQPYKDYTIDRFVPAKHKKDIEKKSVVIPNGIDKFWLENKYEKRSAPRGNEINVVYAGMINANKNIETTIAACNILLEEGFNVKYQVIGRIMDKRYGKLISRNSFVEHIPYCSKEELIDYYRNADIFIMPSKHETFGLVYAEAMSQGLPIVYTRGQGFDGQFPEGEVGYSVQYNSPDEIARRVKDILTRYDSISANCLAGSDRFDWDRIAKEYINIYRQSLETE